MTAVHELAPSSEMTTDPALLGRWFCACGEVLDRYPDGTVALARHLDLVAATDAEAAARQPSPDDVPLFPIDGEDQS